jgi:hypothetical protein
MTEQSMNPCDAMLTDQNRGEASCHGTLNAPQEDDNRFLVFDDLADLVRHQLLGPASCRPTTQPPPPAPEPVTRSARRPTGAQPRASRRGRYITKRIHPGERQGS